jgi:hypothetical protein
MGAWSSTMSGPASASSSVSGTTSAGSAAWQQLLGQGPAGLCVGAAGEVVRSRPRVDTPRSVNLSRSQTRTGQRIQTRMKMAHWQRANKAPEPLRDHRFLYHPFSPFRWTRHPSWQIALRFF